MDPASLTFHLPLQEARFEKQNPGKPPPPQRPALSLASCLQTVPKLKEKKKVKGLPSRSSGATELLVVQGLS